MHIKCKNNSPEAKRIIKKATNIWAYLEIKKDISTLQQNKKKGVTSLVNSSKYFISKEENTDLK